MQLSLRTVTVIVVGVIGIAAGAYTLGVKQAAKPQASNPESTVSAAAGQKKVAGPLPPPGTAMPSNHPEMSQKVQREGKVHVDPSAKFTHFRVGNRNVKSIYIDGKIAWVGTSGGVIRYDTTTDEYRLFDARNGLLSNGIFYVGKLDGRILVGTYGGGMSLFNAAQDKWDNFNIPDGLADAFVYDVLKTPSGDVWVATWSGANRIRGGNLKDHSKWDVFTVENTKGGLPNDWVYGLDQGKDGTIWMATEGGLASFKDGKWKHWNHSDGLGAPYATEIGRAHV